MKSFGKNDMSFYRDAIMESIAAIDEARYRAGIVGKNELSKLLSLAEGYSVMCRESGMNIDESEMFTRTAERFVKEYKYRMKTLNEGFENPFDEDEDIDINTRYEERCDVVPEDAVKIRGCRLWNDNADGKINYRDGKIVAGKFFAPNDTIEMCPVRIIKPADMYSRAVRDFAFDIDPSKNLYGIPFGYASYYRSNLDCNMEPNADYEYIDGPNRSIKIFATKPIKKGNEIILFVGKEMFDNEFNDSDFKYDKEPFYSIKNVRVA